MSTETEALREQFEACCPMTIARNFDGAYISPTVQAAWAGYQAGHAGGTA